LFFLVLFFHRVFFTSLIFRQHFEFQTRDRHMQYVNDLLSNLVPTSFDFENLFQNPVVLGGVALLSLWMLGKVRRAIKGKSSFPLFSHKRLGSKNYKGKTIVITGKKNTPLLVISSPLKVLVLVLEANLRDNMQKMAQSEFIFPFFAFSL